MRPVRTERTISDMCAGCGLAIEGGTEGCQALFDEMTLRALSDVRYARLHRLSVDVYAMQHPDRYGRSAKSFAAHLTGLCCGVEFGGSETVNAAVQRWLSGSVPITRPTEPAQRGAMTIADVLAAEGPAEHAGAVERWARTTWDAYAALHALARAWIATALREAPERSSRR